jgi:hypothetical protein
MIFPGEVTLQGGAKRHRGSDASTASALDCEFSRQQNAGREEVGRSGLQARPRPGPSLRRVLARRATGPADLRQAAATGGTLGVGSGGACRPQTSVPD